MSRLGKDSRLDERCIDGAVVVVVVLRVFALSGFVLNVTEFFSLITAGAF